MGVLRSRTVTTSLPSPPGGAATAGSSASLSSPSAGPHHGHQWPPGPYRLGVWIVAVQMEGRPLPTSPARSGGGARRARLLLQLLGRPSSAAKAASARA